MRKDEKLLCGSFFVLKKKRGVENREQKIYLYGMMSTLEGFCVHVPFSLVASLEIWLKMKCSSDSFKID